MTDPTQPTESAPQYPPVTTDPHDAERAPAPSAFVRVIESLQTLLTALLLAFVFRAFFVEAFIIPTGSMAESLLGQHGAIVCPECGWEFNYGPALRSANRAGTFRAPPNVRCPNCHTRTDLSAGELTIKAGDRILVHKWPYLIGGPLKPQRWDVIVFRDPRDPSQNYIKRLVALPNETIEIIDGDVFIKPDGADEFRPARKTHPAQSMLWFLVFDQDYLPVAAARADQPSAWAVDVASGPTNVGWCDLHTRTIRYRAYDDTPRAVVLDPAVSHDYLQDVYGYNHGGGTNYVGDVRIVGEVTVEAGTGWFRCELVRDGRLFAVQFHHDGRVSLSTKTPDGDETVFSTTKIAAFADGRPRVLEFAHLDYRVYVKVNGRELLATTREQYAPRLDGLRTTERVAPLQLRLVAANMSLRLRGLRVDRDVYYAYDRANTQRAYAGHPFRLGEDEYFVLGDNSPNSADSREWYRVGPHLREVLRAGSYQVGTVRADQIVGKAFFVYLPGLLPLTQGGGWRIPDLGRVRFIR